MKLMLVVSSALVLMILQCAIVQARSTVVVGGTVVMKFSGDVKMSADRRAAVVQAHLDAALRQRKPASSLQVINVRGVYAIVWAGLPICTVDALQAKANAVPASALAMRWLKNIRAAVKDGFLCVDPDSLVIGLGTTHTIRVRGIATGPIDVEAEGSGISTSLSGAAIAIKGTAIGRYKLRVTREGVTLAVPIAVKESAGYIPERVNQSVTGVPAVRDILDTALLMALHNAVVSKPGATVSFTPTSEMPSVLNPGAEARVNVDVRIEGRDYFTVSRVLDVILKNEPVVVQPPALLMVSNRPEKILGEGVLFRARLRRDQPTRLLYSHVNGLGSTQYMWVNLYNPSDKPIRVLVVAADGGPAPEELYVGHRCNTRFLELLSRNQGIILTLPPTRTCSLGHYRLPARELVSGLAHLQLLSGDELVVTVEASPERERVGHIENVFEAPFNPFRIHPKGIFAAPNVQINEKFIVGSTGSTEIPFGKAPWLIDPTSGEPNTGNYGVMYEVRLDLQNPTPQSQKVSLFFQPVNGVAIGSFLVEGKLMETNCLKPPARALISTVELGPQQNRSIRIVTLPQAGSHYPARIVIQSTLQETQRETGGT